LPHSPTDGRFLGNPRPLERSLGKIRIIQKKLSKRKLLSGNWLETKRRLAKECEHWKDFRRYLFSKLGAPLAGEYDLLVLEDLDTQHLIQVGEQSGVRRLRLYDSAFSELRVCLEWVFQERGKTVLAVRAYSTSREYFRCGGVNHDLTLRDRVYSCPHCGFTLDRDLNASLVLLKRSGWVPPLSLVRLSAELRPIPPPPTLLGAKEGEAWWGVDSGSPLRP